MDELLLGPAMALSDAIHGRDVSCREVMAATLARIDNLNPTFNAIVSRRPTEVLLAEALERDNELARGLDKGWMHGFPLAPKDLTDVAGIPTVKGSPLRRRTTPATDGLMASRLRAAGGVFIGKTNTPEFGLGSHTYNPVFGTTVNAWDPTRSAGGSSGGAAVALALGLLPVADGSDMMGSLRNPAGWNNVYGLRPTPGRVPSFPADDVFFSPLGVEGPMARTIEDLAQLLAVQSGYDQRVPLSLLEDPSSLAAPFGRHAHGVRVGWLGDLAGHLAIEADVLMTCEAELATWEELGFRTDACAPFFHHDDLWTAWLTLRGFQTLANFRALLGNALAWKQMKPELQWELEQAQKFSVADVHHAGAVRTRWHQAVLEQLRSYDVLALPSAQLAAFPAEWTWPRLVAGRTMDTYHRWMEVVVPGSMVAAPVLSVPAGFGADGLPVGIQLIGRPAGERALLEIGAAVQHGRRWSRHRPPAAS